MQLNEALETLLAHSVPAGATESVPLCDALGRVLSADVTAPFDQPPFARSALDGYAVRSEDVRNASETTPVTLKVTDEVNAGHVSLLAIGEGEAIRIMTGAPIPAGADCIVRQEHTDEGEHEVRVMEQTDAFDGYCKQGEDFLRGTVLLKEGMVIGAPETAILASIGYDTVSVYARPRVLILSTGDELTQAGSGLQPGKIYDSNLSMCEATFRQWGAEITKMRIVRDDVEECVSAIRTYRNHTDLIVTTGGVSVGKKDIMHEVLDELPAERLFWKVAIKPGSPTLCGLYEGKPLLALSGNPFGAFVTLHLLVRPVYAKMARRPDLNCRKVQAKVTAPFLKPTGQTRFVRAVYRDGTVEPTSGSNANGVLSTLIGCNALMEIPAHSPPVEAGETLRVHLL